MPDQPHRSDLDDDDQLDPSSGEGLMALATARLYWPEATGITMTWWYDDRDRTFSYHVYRDELRTWLGNLELVTTLDDPPAWFATRPDESGADVEVRPVAS